MALHAFFVSIIGSQNAGSYPRLTCGRMAHMGHSKPLEFHHLSSYPKRRKHPFGGQTKTLCRPPSRRRTRSYSKSLQNKRSIMLVLCGGCISGLAAVPLQGGRAGDGPQKLAQVNKNNFLLLSAFGFIVDEFDSTTYAANIRNLTNPLRRTPIYQAFHNFYKFRIPA